MPVAATFVTEVEGKAMLGQVARLDTLVTVVDGKNFFETYGTTERRRDEDFFFKSMELEKHGHFCKLKT